MSQRTKTRRKRKIIDKNTEIVIANNTYGMFVYESKNGETSIQLDNHGDEDFVTYGELRHMKRYLESFELLITSVNSDDDVSIMDVARGLRISDVYEKYFDLVLQDDPEEYDDEEDLAVEDLEDFVNDSEEDEFEEALDSKLRRSIIETSVELYKQQRLSSHEKIRLIRNSRPKDERGDFWSDIDASLED